ncbi:MAG: hypothetical protein ACI4Q3_08715 [Kiritimatiellia bacterium]
METVLQYVTAAVARTGAQLLVVFGVVFVLAVVLWFVSQGIRSAVSSRIGMLYYYLVAPGVACHETGHALGCLLTGTKIAEFVPFRPSSDGTLGYVSHELPDGGSLLGNVAQFVISTGPVWFGSAVILGLSYLVGGSGILPEVETYFPERTPPATCEYVSSVFLAAWQMLRNAVCVWNWRSPWIALYLYAVFCIASEITLSGPDLKGMWKGCGAIAVVLFGVNLLPYAGRWINAGIVWAKPCLFRVQAVLAFVLLLDVVFFCVSFALMRLLKRGE